MDIFEQQQKYMAEREKELNAKGVKIFRLSTTERGEFKECRRRWDFSSFSRQALEPKKSHYALSFGTAMHYGLEMYYSGKESPQGAFRQKWMELSIKTIYGLRGEEVPEWVEEQGSYYRWVEDAFEKALPLADEYFAQDVKALLQLGTDMLSGYENWSQVADRSKELGFKSVEYVEKEFAVVVRDQKGEPYLFTDGGGQRWEIWLVGRFDMVVKDYDDWYWILDHKSSKDKLNSDQLTLDDQMTMYMWALSQILAMWQPEYAEKIAGCYYNVLRKKLPRVPPVLKDGKSLSKAKDIDTTYEVYLQAIIDNGFDPEDYQQILEYLQRQPNTFFQREKVRRNVYEIANAGNLLLLEAIDMLNAPYIYPHFTWDCRWKCDFKELCLTMNRHDDISWMIKALYQKRSLDEGSVYNREKTAE